MLSDKRKYHFLIKFSIIPSLFFVLLTGCAFYPNKTPLIINNFDEEGNSHHYQTINSNKKIKEVKKILNNAKWENSKVEMERKPDFAFYFDDPNAKAVEYRVWISPNKKQVELSEGIDSFANLSEEDSANIFSIFEVK